MEGSNRDVKGKSKCGIWKGFKGINKGADLCAATYHLQRAGR